MTCSWLHIQETNTREEGVAPSSAVGCMGGTQAVSNGVSRSCFRRHWRMVHPCRLLTSPNEPLPGDLAAGDPSYLNRDRWELAARRMLPSDPLPAWVWGTARDLMSLQRDTEHSHCSLTAQMGKHLLPTYIALGQKPAVQSWIVAIQWICRIIPRTSLLAVSTRSSVARPDTVLWVTEWDGLSLKRSICELNTVLCMELAQAQPLKLSNAEWRLSVKDSIDKSLLMPT